jgi:hypothetical protein
MAAMSSRRPLRPRTKRLLLVAGAVETALKAAMLIDLRRRPASAVRGSKKLWSASTIVGSAGLIPLTYFVVGRRPA